MPARDSAMRVRVCRERCLRNSRAACALSPVSGALPVSSIAGRSRRLRTLLPTVALVQAFLLMACDRPGPAVDLPGEEAAQEESPRSTEAVAAPVLRVGPGFREAIVTGTAVAELDAGVRSGGECAGWMGSVEAHVVELSSPMALEFRVASGERPLALAGVALERADSGDREQPGAAMRCTPLASQGTVHRVGLLDEGVWLIRVLVDEATPDLGYRLRFALEGEGTGGEAFPAVRGEGAPPRAIEDGRWGGAHMGPGSAPVLWTGRAGGPRPAEGLGLHCAGWIAETPDHVLELASGMPVRFEAESDEGITIAIRRADGVWHCSDEHSVRQPRLLVALTAGRYEIHIGSLDPHGDPEYSLRVSR